MAQLIFKGPFHFSQLKSLQLKGKAGIYIWGFAYETKNGELSQSVNLQNQNYENETSCILKDEWKFIPYYVGKHESDLEKRLTEHHSVRTDASATKYVRFKKDYYKEFFNDPNYKIFTGDGDRQYRDLTKLVLNNPKSLSYFNNVHLLYTIDKQIKPIYKSITDIPIINCHKGVNLMPDTLDEIVSTKSDLNINTKNNFWFCYAELDEELEKELKNYRSTLEKGSRSEFLKNPEAQTFYSLRGKTISETIDFKSVKSKYTIKAEPTCEHIFNLDSTTKEVIPQDPNDPKSFPGY
jgi:hypothetical protein